jgi:hopene-associated glycosyltransferase HpnB
VPSLALLLAALCLLIWLYLALARGGFWRLRPFDDDAIYHAPPQMWPRVVACIPARNEAETIAQTLPALFQQDYPGEFSIVLIDDHSEDATSQRAQQAAQECNAASRLTIHAASALPPGWTGKMWALHEGTPKFASGSDTGTATGADTDSVLSSRPARPLLRSRGGGICFSPSSSHQSAEPTYFWFTDADIVHAPDTLLRLVARAEQNQLDLTSLMVLLQAKTPPERALIPAFLYFFLQLYPPQWIANPNARTAGAAGGCILLRRAALERIGGFAAIRSEVIDDCALAAAVKRAGGRVWMGLTRKSVSLRSYRSFAEICELIARTAFTQLSYSATILLGTIAALFVTYLAPIALLFAQQPAARLLALATWLLMALTFLPTVRFYCLSPLWSLSLPLIALFYSYATCLSAVRYHLRRGAQWKGRSQAPKPA